MRRARLAPVLAVAAVLLGAPSACGGGSGTGPPDVVLGRDVCAECHMIISELRYAAAYRDASGDPFVFDDIDDMLKHTKRAGVLDDMTAWVHDQDTEKWVGAGRAWYVSSKTFETPMGGGIVAFAHRDSAEKFASTHDGEVLSWKALVEHARSGDLGESTSSTAVPTTER